MNPILPDLVPLRQLTRDGWLLFATRSLRLFAYGLLSVLLMLYLTATGFTPGEAGTLLALAMLGDTAVSLWLTTRADRLGRRRMLHIGAALMVLAGAVFASTGNYWLLLVAATIGVISPSGNEVGPFLSIEQAALSEIVPAAERTTVFAWYNLIGAFATALGSLAGGGLAGLLQERGFSEVASYRPVIWMYGLLGLALAGLFSRVSGAVEPVPVEPSLEPPAPSRWGLADSGPVVYRLAALFSLDAFGGGLVVQSVVAYWFHTRFGTEPAELGAIFFGANLLAGISFLMAARVARVIGLVNTMVFTHLPSNVLLMIVPLMPTARSAAAVLFLRFAISQMDVPTRQSYTMAVVRPSERSAAAGVTGVARSIGSSVSPAIAGALVASANFAAWPFFIAGAIKIAYDLLLWRQFRKVPTRETA